MNKIKKIIDNIYFKFIDYKNEYKKLNDDYNSMPKRKTIKKKHKLNLKFKNNLKRDFIVIFSLAFLGTIIILTKSYLNNPIDLKANKIKEIDIYNFLSEDGTCKKMIVKERSGIEDITSSLNSLKKTKKSNENYDDVFGIISSNNDHIIFRIHYNNKTEIIEYYTDYIVKKDKEIYVDENDISSLWYVLNYSIIDSNINEIKSN